MMSPEFSVWIYGFGAACVLLSALAVLNASYKAKACAPLPPKKPRFALLPKYVVSLPREAGDDETNLSTRLALYGFREDRRDENVIVYSRGSALGDFSVKVAKLIAKAPLPASNPIQLEIEYGVAFGCAFDTGDLWKFCRELSEKIETDMSPQNSNPVETGNPYQPPQT